MSVAGHDIVTDYRAARSLIGLVPQELSVDAVRERDRHCHFQPRSCSAGRPIPPISRRCSKSYRCGTRRMRASAHCRRRHETPRLDRQGSGAQNRRSCSSTNRPLASMSNCANPCGSIVRGLQKSASPSSLTTHYIEEAEEMADRMRRHQQWRIDPGRGKEDADPQARQEAIDAAPGRTAERPSRLDSPGSIWNAAPTAADLVYTYDTRGERTGITTLLAALNEAGIGFKDLHTKQSSLEEIFVSLVQRPSGMNVRTRSRRSLPLRDGARSGVPSGRASFRR